MNNSYNDINNRNDRLTVLLTNNNNNNNSRLNINDMDEINMDTSIDALAPITTRPVTRSLTARLLQNDTKFQKPLMQTCQRLLTNEKPCNIIKILEKSSFTGKMPRCIGNVSNFFFFFFSLFNI